MISRKLVLLLVFDEDDCRNIFKSEAQRKVELVDIEGDKIGCKLDKGDDMMYICIVNRK
ncbi:MAG: hypothetical protein ACK5Z2_01080 [Bacteroidota bacterium]|jgi:hypothetical protein